MSGRDWINWEKYYPDDLNKDNKVKTGQDYFTIPVYIAIKDNPCAKFSCSFNWFKYEKF